MLSIIYDSSEGKRKEKRTDRDCLMTRGSGCDKHFKIDLFWKATHCLHEMQIEKKLWNTKRQNT